MATIYQYKSMAGSIKAVDMNTRQISGYFSAFNVVDSYGDVVMPGAFAKTIQEQGPNSRQPRIKHLLNHDVSQPLGKIIELKEDNYGLFYTSQIGTHSLGDDFLKMVESGLITEHSIGYRVVKQTSSKTQIEENGRETEVEVTQLLELKLFEGSSLTGWGVNQYTPLVSGAKSDVEKLSNRIKQLDKFVKAAEVSQETIELLMLEIKQLTQLVADVMQSTPAAEQAQEPEQKAAQPLDASLILTYLSL